MDESKPEETDPSKKTVENEPNENPINGTTLISMLFKVLFVILILFFYFSSIIYHTLCRCKDFCEHK